MSTLPPPERADGPGTPPIGPFGDGRQRRQTLIVGAIAAVVVLALVVGAYYVGRASRQAAIDDLMRERDALYSERDELGEERDGLVSERRRLIAERDGVTGERDELRAQFDALQGDVSAMEGQVTSLGEELDELQDQYDRTAVCSPAAEQAVVLLDEWEAFLTSLDRWLQTEVGSPEEAAIGQELDTQAIGIEELRIEVERGLAACRATVAAAGG